MRVFKRTGEVRINEPAFRPGRTSRGREREGAEASHDATGFNEQSPSIGFKDVAGLDGVVQDLRDVVAYAADPERFAALGARPPTGILLFGPPGCGKTLVGRALAGEVGLPFYFVSATSFVERFVGLGASRIRELFDTAGRDSPCVVFIDEIDAIGRHRTEDAGDREFDHTLNQLLVGLDGFLTTQGVITIGATNRRELLDPALVRPGRFDRHIELGRPDRTGRLAILRLHAQSRPYAPEVDWARIAEATDDCSSAELAGMVNESALLAARNGQVVIERLDVEAALDRQLAGRLRSRSISTEHVDRRAAHEAGHTLLAMRLPHATPCVRPSIGACGPDVAVNPWTASQRTGVSSGPQLLAELIVLMGGRAAEELLVGSASTLSENDLSAARALAERIEQAGLVDADSPTSPRDLLDWAKKEADRQVMADRDALEAIAAALRVKSAVFIDELRSLAASGTRGQMSPPTSMPNRREDM